MPVKGRLWLDAGAQKAVCDRTQSLLAAGLLRASGDFLAQDAVVLCSQEGTELARGLVNYSREEVEKIKVPASGWWLHVLLAAGPCQGLINKCALVCRWRWWWMLASAWHHGLLCGPHCRGQHHVQISADHCVGVKDKLKLHSRAVQPLMCMPGVTMVQTCCAQSCCLQLGAHLQR